MYSPRTIVKRSLRTPGETDRPMPVYSLELQTEEANDLATSSSVWRQSSQRASAPLFDRLIQATEEAIQLMTGMQLQRTDIGPEQTEICGLMELKGERQRLLIFSLPLDCASALASNVLGSLCATIDEELVSDYVGELCNIIVGRVRSRVNAPDEVFEMGTPIVVFTDRPQIHWQAEASLQEACFTTDAGGMILRLLTRDGSQAV